MCSFALRVVYKLSDQTYNRQCSDTFGPRVGMLNYKATGNRDRGKNTKSGLQSFWFPILWSESDKTIERHLLQRTSDCKYVYYPVYTSLSLGLNA